MITNFNQFKQKMNESVKPTIDPCTGPTPEQLEYMSKITVCATTAMKCGLNRQLTEKIVETVFTNPAKAPEEINVKFVKEHLNDVKKYISFYEDKDFGRDYVFSTTILESKTPFELVMSIDSAKISKMCEALKANIKKQNFNIVLENNIFYINDMSILNDHNKKIVLTTLEKQGAINIATQLKWARTLI